MPTFFLKIFLLLASFFIFLFLGSPSSLAAIQCEYVPKDSSQNIIYEGTDVEHQPWVREMESAECNAKCSSEAPAGLKFQCAASSPNPEGCSADYTTCGEVTSPTLTVTCKFTPKNLRGGVVDSYGISTREVLSTSESECQRMCDALLARCMAIDIAGSPLCSASETTCEKTNSASTADSTSTTPASDVFTPVMPTLGVSLPTLSNFSDPTLHGETPNRYLWIPWIGQYIAAIYKYIIGIVGVLAGIMIVIGGLLWLTAGGAADRVSTAKSFIESSLVGLVIALTSYLLLYAINPNLVEFESLRIRFIEKASFADIDLPLTEADISEETTPSTAPLTPGTPSTFSGTPTSGLVERPEAVCTTVSECQRLCSQDPASVRPTTTLTTDQLQAIPTDIPGLKIKRGVISPYLRADVIPHLIEAAEKAQTWPGGPYELYLISAHRPFEDQFNSACRRIREGRGDTLGGLVAWPGSSIHGTGAAIDVALAKDGRELTSGRGGENEKLANILFSVGWVRYCKEPWHFEFGTADIPCRSNTCTWSEERCQ